MLKTMWNNVEIKSTEALKHFQKPQRKQGKKQTRYTFTASSIKQGC